MKDSNILVKNFYREYPEDSFKNNFLNHKFKSLKFLNDKNVKQELFNLLEKVDGSLSNSEIKEAYSQIKSILQRELFKKSKE